MKAFIKFIYFVTNLFVISPKGVESKSILLIRLDAIGDYLLFRNFIKSLISSEKYKGSHITVVGNLIWKRLAQELDGELVDDFIWVDRKKFSRNLWYRYKKLQQIASKGYETVLSPVFSREFFYGDWIVRTVNARDKIGSTGDLSNITSEQKKISDTWYTELVPAQKEVLFEFFRNKEFFEYLLNRTIDISKPNLELEPKILGFELPKNYAVLVIGAGAKFRKWDIENFAIIARYLKDKYDYSIVLCGGVNDRKEAEKFSHIFNYDYMDLVGKTSIIDLLYVIYNGNLMVSNETSAPHFAVALEVKNIFVISNGNHYGRFTPYPPNISEDYHVIYHPEVEKNKSRYRFSSNLNINDISTICVESKIDEVLNSSSPKPSWF